jgi:hypothetical protein
MVPESIHEKLVGIAEHRRNVFFCLGHVVKVRVRPEAPESRPHVVSRVSNE